MEKFNKISIPVSIIFATVIFTVSLGIVNIVKQNSIERQQLIKLQEENRIRELKIEQANRDYIVDRKKDCYLTYERERVNWANTAGFNYDEDKDICFVQYKFKSNEEKDSRCGQDLALAKSFPDNPELIERVSNCAIGIFTRKF